MAVVFDLLGVQSKHHGERGIARYVLQCALALEAHNPNLIDIYLIRSSLPVPGSLEQLVRTGKVRTAEEVAASPPSHGVFVVTSPYELEETLDTIVPPWCRGARWRRTGILYDLIPLIYPDVYLTPAIKDFYRARTHTLSSLDHLFAISESSKEDAVALLDLRPDSITNIAAGADHQFKPPTLSKTATVEVLNSRIPDLRENYVLFPSGIEWRKNVEGMLKAYAALPESMRSAHQLVMVCRTNEDEIAQLRRMAADLGIVQSFLATGFVDDADLVRLYQAAKLVVFPSLYEGFGLPVLEARKCGAPTICSDSSSLREVQPDPSARFDPLDHAAFAEKLYQTLGDEAELERLRTSKMPPYSWAWGAERMAPVLQELASEVSDLEHNFRLAIVSPMPPHRSGIATYSYRLLEHLAGLVNTTVFVDDTGINHSVPSGVEVANTHQLEMMERLNGSFDEVVYFMGNSHFHVEALEMLRKRPGVVLMHEARMVGLYQMQHVLAPHRMPGGTVGGLLKHLYPDQYRDYLYDSDVISAPEAERFGILMTREIAGLATRVLVHSQFAADLIRIDSGEAAEVVFPLPVHATPKAAPAGAFSDLDAPVISSFGMVSPSKHPELLIRALAEVLKLLPGATLRFVGEADPAIVATLDALIVKEDLVGKVQMTGHVDDLEYARNLSETTLAVQLRQFTNGESSAAVADLIGSGVPTIATKIGAMTELPHEAVELFSPAGSPEDLALSIHGLLRNPSRLEQMRMAGLDYAADNTYEAASRRLLDTLYPLSQIAAGSGAAKTGR